MPTIKLKLDYDCDSDTMIGKFKNGLIYSKRVFERKAETVPNITVTQVKQTHKGYHVKCDYRDDITDAISKKHLAIPQRTFYYRAYILLLQTCLGSDKTRSLFDMRRAIFDEDFFNLMFDYKNGETFIIKDDIKDNLNAIIKEVIKPTQPIRERWRW